MLRYTNIKSGDTMSKNKEILNKWKKEISQYEPLTISQSQELYNNMINCNNENIKKQIRDRIIIGTLYIVYNFIETNGYAYMNGTSYDMNDIINSSIETWIKKIDSGELLNVDSFKNMITRDMYNDINENIGINIDIDPKEYLYHIKGFTDIVYDYMNMKRKNSEFDYYDLIEHMKKYKDYIPLLKRINNAYYELKQFENSNGHRDPYHESYLKKHVNENDITSFELLEGIIKSFENEEVYLSRTTLYKLRFLIISNGIEYQRRDINNIVYRHLEEALEQKELRKILINLINNCTGVTDYHRKLILARTGFYGEQFTLEQFAKENGHNREYARQAEAKILRKLRTPSRTKQIKDFLK